MSTKAIILAAGIGSRLAPISTSIPKSLTKVAGREIIDYQIVGYLEAGIREQDITVVVGYKAEVMVEFFKTKYPLVNIVDNKEYNETNNMYSLYLCIKEIVNEDFDTIFVNNADCIYENHTIKNLLNSPYDNAIAVELGEFNDESMKVVFSENEDKLTNIAKTIEKSESYGLSIDLYKISRPALLELLSILNRYIEHDKDLTQWTEVAFPELFIREKFMPHNIENDRWFEIDNLVDLQNADILFSDFMPQNKKAFILDIDGTVMIGDQPIAPAVDWIKDSSSKTQFYYLTNNTSKTPSEYVKKLASVGIVTDESHISTPLVALSEYIEVNSYKNIYLVANDAVTNYMAQLHPDVSFDYNYEDNQAVVLTYDNEITYDKLRNVCLLLNNRNVEYIATHQDTFCPTPNGGIPDIGSYISLIDAVTSKKPHVYFGKPDKNLIEPLLKKFSNNDLAIAGDRLYTDKKLADNTNIEFVCVLSGDTQRIDLAVQPIGRYPAIVVETLGSLRSIK